MRTEEFSVVSPFDGLELSCIVVEPRGPVRGLVQFSHGMEEHKERYLPLMEFLAERGFASVIHDHRGHGQSVRSPDDLGYFYDDSAQAIVDDVVAVQAVLRRRWPDEPLVLFGHSMGSLVARVFLKEHDRDIQGLVLCGAPFNNAAAGLGLAAVATVTAVKGDRAKSGLVRGLVFGPYNKGLPGDHELRWLSANEENVLAYVANPLDGFGFTLNGYKNLMLLITHAFDAEGWGRENPDLPILFIAGADDPVIGGAEKWRESQQFLRDRGYANVTGKLYEGMRHEILNETDRRLVFDDVADFVETVCCG